MPKNFFAAKSTTFTGSTKNCSPHFSHPPSRTPLSATPKPQSFSCLFLFVLKIRSKAKLIIPTVSPTSIAEYNRPVRL
jgi:hypothetical protein